MEVHYYFVNQQDGSIMRWGRNCYTAMTYKQEEYIGERYRQAYVTKPILMSLSGEVQRGACCKTGCDGVE